MTRLRWVLLIVGLCAAAAVGLPSLKVDQFREPIRRDLEAALGRRVDIDGPVTLRLFPFPGFSAVNAVIHELPEYGVEPFAYVSTLEVSVRFTSLLKGRLELSGIRLVEPSVNLLRNSSAGWNFQPFLNRALGHSADRVALPAIEISSGRINFKSDDLKASLYLSDTDALVEIDPNDPDRIDIRFAGDPARTDRAVWDFGRLTGRGWLKTGGAGGGSADLSVAIERTAISEVMTLLEGTPSQLGGFLASRAHLTGPLANLDIDGAVQLEQIDRSNWLFPGSSRWSLDFRGSLDLPGGTMHVETRAPASGTLPLSLRVRASQLSMRPRWGAILTFRGMPYSSLRALAAETGASFPSDLPLEGELSGALGFSPTGGMRGELSVSGGSVSVSGEEKYPLESASIVIDGPVFQLLPASIRLGAQGTLTAEAKYNLMDGASDVRLQGAGLSLDAFQALWTRLAALPLPPLISQSSGGIWSGNIHYVQHDADDDGVWNGAAEIADVRFPVDGLAGDVRVQSASLRFRGATFDVRSMEGTARDLHFTGSYSYDAARLRPHRLRLSLPEASLSDFEQILAPSLQRSQGLLDRTLGRRTRVPEWLRARRAEAAIEIGSLQAGGNTLQALRGSVYWDSIHAEIRDFTAAFGTGTLGGSVRVELDGPEPAYTAEMDLNGFAWHDGLIDSQWTLRTAGFGDAVLANLRADGSFTGRGVTVAPDSEWRSATGCFLVVPGQGGPRLQLTGLQATIGGEIYQGQGTAGPDGRLTIELAGTQKQVRLAGRWTGLTFELAQR